MRACSSLISTIKIHFQAAGCILGGGCPDFRPMLYLGTHKKVKLAHTLRFTCGSRHRPTKFKGPISVFGAGLQSTGHPDYLRTTVVKTVQTYLGTCPVPNKSNFIVSCSLTYIYINSSNISTLIMYLKNIGKVKERWLRIFVRISSTISFSDGQLIWHRMIR